VEIGEWLKGEGDHVERDEDLVVIETEKATAEIPAPQSGIITKILRKSREKASVGDVIGYIETEKVAVEPDGPNSTKTQSPTISISKSPESKTTTAEEKREAKNSETNQAAAQTSAQAELTNAKVKRPEAKPTQPVEKKTDPDETAAEERENGPPVAEEDQLEAEETEPQGTWKAPPARKPVPQLLRSLSSLTAEREQPTKEPDGRQRVPTAGEDRREEPVPMTQLRRRIAERLVQAQQTAALLTTFNEIDMSAVIALRDSYREAFRKKYDIKLGFMSFFVKAAIEALKLVPEVNAEVRGENIVYRNFFDIGVAVGGGKGLVVPVIRSAERLSFAELERAIADFAQRARANKLKPDELQGGTFTISNGGIYGSLLSTPIINLPQSGILGMHAIQDRPVAREGAVVVRPMMYVALTYDHRIVDGREAVTFLKHIKDLVEDPARILLQL
jgi:2-oxoglutarate dehydrogenase E2 component (dihydrolipoamide succinyltransferase)